MRDRTSAVFRDFFDQKVWKKGGYAIAQAVSFMATLLCVISDECSMRSRKKKLVILAIAQARRLEIALLCAISYERSHK